jgi:hypothetical protein
MLWPFNHFQNPALRGTIEPLCMIVRKRENRFIGTWACRMVNGRFDLLVLHLWMV